jgi:hypothetical protein
MDNQTKTPNYPFIVLTGFGIIATLIFLFIFVYQKSISTVREKAIVERAYLKVKPQEYYYELKNIASKNGFTVLDIQTDTNYFLIQLYSKNYIEKAKNVSLSLPPMTVITLSIYDLVDGTAVVGNNPYLWRVLVEGKASDSLAKEYYELVDLMLNDVYYSLKEKKKKL